MLMQYSFDLRRKLIEAWQNWDGPQEEWAELLGVSRGWVQNVLRRFEHSGDPAAPLHRQGPARCTGGSSAGCDGGRVGPTPPGEWLDRVPRSATKEPAAEKKSWQASERDTPRVRKLRARGRTTCRDWDPKHLIFLEESGLHLALTRLSARAPRGGRAVGAVPQNEGQNLTVLAALDRNGIRAALLGAGATDGEVFRTLVERVLVPKRRRGDRVALDNLSAHQAVGVAETMARAGAQRLYLPPYSPDLNPMELAGSKIKGQLRTAGARPRSKLQRCWRIALPQISPKEARAWFRHSGYGLH
jgi:transposase